MTISFADGMSRATALTQVGKLSEATALIQSLLATGPAVNPDAGNAPGMSGAVVDGTCTRLADAPPSQDRTAETATEPRQRPNRHQRQSLAETLRRLAAGRMPRSATPAAPDLPDGAQFLSLTHTGPQGSRVYRLYVPAQAATMAMPLIVMLHGCTQTPEDFAAGTGMNALAERHGCLIAWPAQPQGANGQKCWNWFRPEDQARERGEPAVIAGLVRDILRDHPVDPARVYVAGLSAGGAAAAILGAAYPDVFAAVGVHSGLPVGGAQDMPSAFAAMRSGAKGRTVAQPVPTIVFHGRADSTVHPANGAAVIAQALPEGNLALTQRTGRSEGGRGYRQTIHTDPDGRSHAEHWEIDGAGHAWAGGMPAGSYTDPAGPNASAEMMRFFLQHRRG